MAKPIPFVGPPGQRNTSTLDQRFVNVLFEVQKDANPSQYPVNCIRRPGTSTSTRPFGGATNGRGIYYWGGTDNIYSVSNSSIYCSTTLLTTNIATSTGRVWFAESHVGSGNRLLYISDGAKKYIVTSTNAITTVAETNFPSPNLGPIVYLDGYLFSPASNGKIWNSVLNASSSTKAADFITADTYGSDLEAIHLMKDQILAWTKNRIEFFFNNGNPTNSPLLRIDQNTLGFGMAHRNSLAWAGETACFVSENSGNGDGGRSVFVIQSLGKVTEVSDPPLNRLLAAEGASISSCSAWMERLNGHPVYWLNLASADRTFTYDTEAGMWSEQESATSTRLNLVSAASKGGTVYAQHATDGYIYTFQPTVYQDGGSNYFVRLQTARSNFGSHISKTEPELGLVGDTTGAVVNVYVSDDDYASWTSIGTIEMSTAFKNITRLGAFYSRAHKFETSTNAAFRVQAWLPEVKKGIG